MTSQAVGHRTVLALCLLTTVSLTACAGVPSPVPCTSQPCLNLSCPKPSGPVAIALEVHRHAPAPTPLPPAVSALAADAADNGHLLSLIRVDGKSDVHDEATFSSSAQNEYRRNEELRQFLVGMTDSAAEARAEAPETDPLQALTLAGRQTGEGGAVVFIGSGLATTGDLSFRSDGMLDADPDEVAAELKRKRVLPELRGRTVLFYGLGDVAGPQPDLGERRRRNLIAIWQKIAERGGAACVHTDQAKRNAQPLDGDQPVSLIEAPPLDPVPAPVQSPNCTEAVFRDAGSIGFQSDTAVLREPDAARATLRAFADRIIGDGLHGELVGTTASVGPEAGRIVLSQQRAEAVRDLLIELGVPADRLTARGVGANWPGHPNDIGTNGELLPGPAAAKRSVILRLGC